MHLFYATAAQLGSREVAAAFNRRTLKQKSPAVQGFFVLVHIAEAKIKLRSSVRLTELAHAYSRSGLISVDFKLSIPRLMSVNDWPFTTMLLAPECF